jgi:hypothetical protein
MVGSLGAILDGGQPHPRSIFGAPSRLVRDNEADRGRFTRGENAAMDGRRPNGAAIAELEQP